MGQYVPVARLLFATSASDEKYIYAYFMEIVYCIL